MRLACVCLVFAFGCGSKASGGDDVIDDSGPHDDGDPCANPGDCPPDTGLFVALLKGADTNPGTKAQPFKTIGAAITRAKALGGAQVVFVAQGNYQEKVTLAQGVSLNGGYECNATACSWSRDLAAFESTITNQDFEGVLAVANISAVTLLGGFKIVGKDGVPPSAPGSVGVTLNGAAPTLRGNKIIAGTVTGGNPGADRSIGIAMRSTGPNVAQIENNDVTGGSAIGLSAAISMEPLNGALSYANITANVLRSGTARRSDVIAAFGAGAATVISNNDMTAGNSNGGSSNGIETTSPMTITENRINTDANAAGMCTNQTAYCTGIASFGALLTIKNNVIYGPKGFRTAAVFLSESEVPAGDVVLNANYLNGGGQGGPVSGVSRSESSAVVVSIGPCNTCGLKGIIGRVRNNILDGGINLNRYGVREDPSPNKTSRVELLQANDIWFAANLAGRNDTLYRQVTIGGMAIDTKSVVILNQMTTPSCTLNQNADPLIDSTWHLMAGSPCAQTGVVAESPPIDFDGQGRPSAGLYDIGPDEM